jgi:hypothetical protein
LARGRYPLCDRNLNHDVFLNIKQLLFFPKTPVFGKLFLKLGELIVI